MMDLVVVVPALAQKGDFHIIVEFAVSVAEFYFFFKYFIRNKNNNSINLGNLHFVVLVATVFGAANSFPSRFDLMLPNVDFAHQHFPQFVHSFAQNAAKKIHVGHHYLIDHVRRQVHYVNVCPKRERGPSDHVSAIRSQLPFPFLITLERQLNGYARYKIIDQEKAEN